MDGLFENERQGQKFELCLWMDDDNILTPEGFDLLLNDLDKYPLVDGVMGWYWLQPHGYQIEPMVSCGDFESNNAIPMRPHTMYSEPFVEGIEYGGMGSWLVRWNSLKEVGKNSFAPIILKDSQWGFAGDDCSFFLRALELEQNYAVDKRVFLPHLKLREAGYDSTQFIELPDSVKPALQIQGWMKPEELLWLYTKAQSMNSIVEIGSWKGRSAYALAAGCIGMVTCIDTWEGASDLIVGSHTLREEAKLHNIYAEFWQNLKCFNNVTPFKQDSVSAALNFGAQDMVFIDGSHEFQDVVNDLEAWEGKATKLLCGHDIDRADVKRALEVKQIPYQRGPGVIWFYEIGKAA